MRIRFKRLLLATIGSLTLFCLIAAATPGAGRLFNYFDRALLATAAVHEGAHIQGWNLQLELVGATDVVQQDAALAPGGYSGWHSHPAPVLVSVKSGTALVYQADNPTCAPIVYPTGSAFVEPADKVHNLVNAGTTNLEILATYLVPKGMATRQEGPQPAQCPF